MDYGLLSDNCSSDLLCPGANCPWQDNVDQYGRHYFYGGYQDSVGNMSNLFDACNCSSWHAETYHVSANLSVEGVAEYWSLGLRHQDHFSLVFLS